MAHVTSGYMGYGTMGTRDIDRRSDTSCTSYSLQSLARITIYYKQLITRHYKWVLNIYYVLFLVQRLCVPFIVHAVFVLELFFGWDPLDFPLLTPLGSDSITRSYKVMVFSSYSCIVLYCSSFPFAHSRLIKFNGCARIRF